MVAEYYSSAMARRPPALLGLLALALLCWPFLRVIAQIKDEVSVTKPQELREALLSGATQIMVAANLNFNSENWPDPPVAIAKQVTIYSLYRFKLDFCGSSGAPARPLINVTALGSLLVHRVFLRNFLPSVPQNLSGLGPVPALLSSGGPISFRFVVFHFLPAVTWVFDASVSDSFWAREGRTTALSNIYTGQPVQLLQPALYLVKYSSLQNLTAKYSMDTCFAPMDLDSCYADDAEDTALIYCLYTFADSLRNPTVRHIRVFHDIGLDRLAYRRSSPFAVNGSKSYRACPRSQPSINLENLYAAVVVRDAVDFTGLRFKASLATNFTSWPPDLPVLLSLFDVAGSGVVSLNDVVIDVPDLAGLVGRLKALPGCCTADPTRPNLRPELDTWPTAAELQAAAAVAAQPVNGRGVIYDAWRPDAAAGGGGGGGEDDVSRPSVRIRHWVLTRNAWQSYAASALNTYDALNAPSAAAWGFGNVTVRQADNANARALCFGGALEQGTVLRSGVTMVASELELRQALIKGGRYIQVISDMKLTAANWPGGDAAVVINAGIVEVRGCHPQYGKRFTIDLSDLNAIVQARGRLIFQGDLRFINVGWVTVNRSQLMSVASGVSDVSLLGAFAPAAASGVGAVECEGVVIDGVYDPAGFRAEDLLAVLHLNHMTAEVRARNATLRGDGGLTLGFWSVNQTAPLGKWVFTNTDISWVPVDGDGGGGGAAVGTDAPPPPPDGGGGRAAAAPVQIIVPCVIGGAALMTTTVVLGVVLMRRRRSRYGLKQQSLSKLAAAAAMASAGGGGGGGGHILKDSKDPKAAAAAFSSAMAEALAQAHSSGGEGTDSDAAAALAAVLQTANKIISNGNSNASASGTRTDVSGVAAAAAAAALAALGKVRSDTPGGAGAAAAAAAAAVGGGGGAGGRGDFTLGHAAARVNAVENWGKGPLGNINAAKRDMVVGRHAPDNCTGAALDDLTMQAVLGEGSYGRVYRALWRGTTVAVKVILLPAHMSGRERHERMAVMEAAISSSLSHPNIVQTYTYGAERVEGAKARSLGMRLAGSRGANSALPEASTNPLTAHHSAAVAVPGTAAGGAGPGRNGDNGAGGGGGGGGGGGVNGAEREDDIIGWEIRLVQEYCDLGSLRDKLKTGAFLKLAPSAVVADGVLTPPSPPPSPSPPPPPAAAAATATAAATPPHRCASPLLSPASMIAEEDEEAEEAEYADGGGGGAAAAAAASSPPSCVLASPPPHLRVVDLAAVLDTAIDVARALAHLHREGIIHADLKPGNVLLKGSTSDPRGFVAKVADFGLSMRLENNETHVSNAYHGTLAYMAPETLLHGHVSRASDVYSFGILLYELYTGDVAFRSVPKALIGHAITKENLRPVFPPTGPLGAPFEYQLLACRCWESNPEIRPEFDFILEDLKRMRVRLCATVPDGGGGSIGNMGRLTPEAAGGGGGGGPTGFGFPSEAAPAVGRLWGLSAVVHSRQGLNYLVQTSQGIGAKPFFRECGGVGGVGEGSLESDRSLSYSNSTSMCSTDAVLTRPSHNVTGGAAATGAKDGGGGSVGPGVVQGFAGGSGLHGDVRTAPYPGCRDAPAQDEAAVDEEEAAAVVRSL